MDKRIKRLWIAALRSGKYKQASGTLIEKTPSKKIKGYCCLGVLCRVQGAKFDRRGFPYFGKVPDLSLAPNENVNWGHGTLINPKFTAEISNHKLSVLMNMNDTGSSFKQIATWISKNL